MQRYTVRIIHDTMIDTEDGLQAQEATDLPETFATAQHASEAAGRCIVGLRARNRFALYQILDSDGDWVDDFGNKLVEMRSSVSKTVI